jgi:hypothetical protein
LGSLSTTRYLGDVDLLPSTEAPRRKFHDRMAQGGAFSVILKFPKQGDTNHAFDDGPKDVDP